MTDRFHKILAEVAKGERPFLTHERFTAAQVKILERVMDLSDLENKTYFEHQIKSRQYECSAKTA